MPKFYGAVDLVQNELRNAVVQNLGSAPASPVKGQLYLNSSDNTLYYWDGTTWQAMKSGTGGPPTGPAGGDLSGTYPNPTVLKAAGAFSAGGDVSVGTTNGNHALKLLDAVGGNPVPIYQQTSGVRIDSADSSKSLTLVASAGLGIQMNPAMRITGVSDPTSAGDAANKNYVDNQVQVAQQGLDSKASVKAATTANIALIGGPTSIDGVNIVNGDRILVKNQTAPAENGIYYLNAGNYVRTLDADVWTELVSAYTWVEQGTINADTGWNCTVDSGGTLGTTAVTWVQFNGAGTITAGAGLTKTGNTLDVGAGNGISVAADSVAVDPSVVALKSDLTPFPHRYVTTLVGNIAYATGEQVIHSLNTFDVLVQVFLNAAPYPGIEVDVERTSSNMVTVRYNPNIGAARCVVIG